MLPFARYATPPRLVALGLASGLGQGFHLVMVTDPTFPPIAAQVVPAPLQLAAFMAAITFCHHYRARHYLRSHELDRDPVEEHWRVAAWVEGIVFGGLLGAAILLIGGGLNHRFLDAAPYLSFGWFFVTFFYLMVEIEAASHDIRIANHQRQRHDDMQRQRAAYRRNV